MRWRDFLHRSGYFKHVLREGQPLIRVAHLRQNGRLRTDIRATRWFHFEAQQVVAPLDPGFVWDARVAVMPLLQVRVRDAYARGTGAGRVSLLSAIPIKAARGGTELNSGALHRYLAEAAWYPTALLPTAALSWSPIDSMTALASLTDAGQSVSLEFRFNEAGELTGIYSPGRWGFFEGGYRQVPWEGHFSNYEEKDGMLVPSRGEVGWYSGGEWRKVWEGNLLEGHYEFERLREDRATKPRRRRPTMFGRTLVLLLLVPCVAAAQGTGPRYINPAGLAKPTGYTHLVIAPDGRTVYIAGQVAFDSAGKVVGAGDFRLQAEQVFRNLELVLQSVGGTLSDLVKTTTFITDIRHLPALREVRTRRLDQAQPPANTLLVVAGLARPELLIEIEAVAVLRSIVRQ